MDKGLLLIGLCFIALPLVVLALGMGWLFNDYLDKDEHDTDSDSTVLPCDLSGKYRGMDIHYPGDPTPEEVKRVLDYLMREEGREINEAEHKIEHD